jgi:hydroxymethylpyrimidine/phosphomethylpyrimidine kinase
MKPAALTIAASDPSGGAGIEADLKVFARHRVFGMSALTALTVQNAAGLRQVHPTPAKVLRLILAALAEDLPIKAIKIGAIPNGELVEVIAEFLAERPQVPVVLDPVLKASAGGSLAEPEVVAAIKEKLLPRVTLFTPNYPEAEAFGLLQKPVADASDFPRMSFNLLGAKAILLKGGHLPGSPADVLVFAKSYLVWKDRRLKGDYHGLGCALSSAIAANLARGKNLTRAVELGRAYVRRQMKKAIMAPGGVKVLPHT